MFPIPPRPGIAQAIFGGAVLALLAIQPASASTFIQTGNQQYTNVNIAADVDALSVVGDIGNTGITMTFENMIGPDGSTQVAMHGQHGVAFVESFADSQSSTTHTGFSSITLRPQAGYGFTAGDFALDQLDSLTSPTGVVTLTALDQFGNSYSNNTLGISQSGENHYNFFTQNGELVTLLTITVATTDLLQDIKQVSVDVSAVPLPAALPLFATGLGVMGLLARRRKRKNAAAITA